MRSIVTTCPPYFKVISTPGNAKRFLSWYWWHEILSPSPLKQVFPLLLVFTFV